VRLDHTARDTLNFDDEGAMSFLTAAGVAGLSGAASPAEEREKLTQAHANTRNLAAEVAMPSVTAAGGAEVSGAAPSVEERKKLVQVHANKRNLAAEVPMPSVTAAGGGGYVTRAGAQLTDAAVEETVTEAAETEGGSAGKARQAGVVGAAAYGGGSGKGGKFSGLIRGKPEDLGLAKPQARFKDPVDNANDSPFVPKA